MTYQYYTGKDEMKMSFTNDFCESIGRTIIIKPVKQVKTYVCIFVFLCFVMLVGCDPQQEESTVVDMYHETFYLFGWEGRVWIDSCDGMAVIWPDRRTQAIIDVETGRELRRFNNRNPNYHRILIMPDNMAIVRQSEGRRREAGAALIDIISGDKIIPFGEYADIFWVQNGMAEVESLVYDGLRGLIELETGRVIIPFEYHSLQLISDELVLVTLPSKTIWRGLSGILCIRTGVEVWPIEYDSLFISHYDSTAVVRIDGESAVLDLESKEEIIPFGKYEFIFQVGYGMVSVSGEDLRGRALIYIDGEEEIIPLGIYEEFWAALSEDLVIVSGGAPVGRSHERGVMSVETGKLAILRGLYDPLFITPSRYVDGRMVLRYNSQARIFDFDRREKITPFGEYSDIQLIEGGFMAAQRWGEGVWRIKRIEDYY